MYLLDTDHIGILQRRTQPQFERLWSRISQHQPLEFFTPIISFHEQVLGWNTYMSRARDQEGVVRAYLMFERILTDFSTAQILPFDTDSGRRFESLRQQKIRIATMDLRIAAIALAQRATLLTRNLVDFRKVPDLSVEDWTT
ncbi:MAG: PilT protein domain protein [Phycisphaerales bacterium]|nr:PilT protein domain protein [Phycisphaerales bacterium]